MSLERALQGSTVVRLGVRLRDSLAARAEPITQRLVALDRALVQVVQGSRLHGWLTADPDPEPVVIDLRETYTVGPVLALLDRLGTVATNVGVTSTTAQVIEQVEAAPVRALGFTLCLSFSVSLLATILGGDITAPVYGFHAFGLLFGLFALRERRDAAALAESPGWGTLLAIFAPPEQPAADS